MLRYYLTQRHNPKDPEGDRKYYAILKSKDIVQFSEFADDIADYTAVNTPDVKAVIEALIKLVSRDLLRGRVIKLGELGTFYLTIHSNGKETIGDFTLSDIKGISLRFKPNKVMKKNLKNVEFGRIENPNGKK